LPINQQRAFGKFHYPEYAELAGWVIGDGTITLEREKQQAYVICYCDEINTVAPRLRKDLLVVYKRNNKSSNQSPTFEGRREIQRGFNFEKRVMHSNVLGRLMKEDGLVPRNKHHVPKSIWQGDKETIAAFIRGFFSADGSVQLTNSISIRNKQVNTSILYECQLLLNQFNIVSQFLFRKNAGKKLMNDGKGGMKLYNSRAEYELAITGRINVEKFINEIGFIQESQNNKAKRWLEIHKGSNNSVPKDYLKVKEVALLEPQETFCLTEPQTHEIVIQTMKIGNCGEQPLLPYEACNLGSINIDKFVEDNKINLEKLKPVIHIAIRFLNGVIDVNHYVIPEIEKICVGNRKIGLGIMGFADALFKLNIGYNTQEAINLAKQIMKFVNDEAQNESERLAEKFDVFNNWKGSRWDTEWKRKQRNAACTTIAPTGTISIIANCSGGIEPLFSLAFQRNILDGKKLIEVNTEFKKVAKANKYWGYIEEELFGMIIEKGSLRHISNIPETIKKIFVCAHDIAPEWHIKMQAAFQEHCASSISKTINFPNKATLEDTYKIYQMAYDLKCKGITIYRDDCRDNQPMSLKNIVVKEAEEIWSARAPRRPTELEGFVHLIKPNGKTYAIFVGKLKNHVFEVFALDHKLAMLADGMTGKIVKEKGKDKGGKEINFYNFESGAVLVRKLNGYEDNELSLLTRIISTALRHGTPIEFIIDQICKAKVPINHVGKAIAKALSNHIDKEFANGKFKCWECGSTNITWQGSCRTCIECGRSSCSG
jgi:ribonucleoside-diphosphate reductase alpha chain